MIKSYFIDAIHRLGELKNLRFSSIDLSSHWTQLVLLILVILLLSFLTDLILSHTIFGKNYRVFVAPGVIVHELSHAFFCLITGAKIKSVSLFDADGGSVAHEQSKIPVLGPVLIAFAPLAIGITAIFILSQWIGLKTSGIDILNISYNSVFHFLRTSFESVNFSSYLNWVLIYLVFSIAITMTPSRQDIKNALLSIIILGLIGFVIFRFFAIRMSLAFLPLSHLLVIMTTVSILLIFALLLSIIIFAISSFAKHK